MSNPSIPDHRLTLLGIINSFQENERKTILTFNVTVNLTFDSRSL